MKPILVLRLIPDTDCVGCGRKGYCCEKTRLCLWCFPVIVAMGEKEFHARERNERLARNAVNC